MDHVGPFPSTNAHAGNGRRAPFPGRLRLSRDAHESAPSGTHGAGLTLRANGTPNAKGHPRRPAVSPPAWTDAEALIAAACRGDADAFGKLLTAADAHLECIAFRWLPDSLRRCPHARHGFVQQCRLRALSAFHARGPDGPPATFRGGTLPEFVAWLTAIAENLAVSMLRRQQTAERLGLLCRNHGSLERMADDSGHADPAVRAERAELLAALDAAIDRLPAADREILHLHWIEQLSYREIAARTGRSEQALRAQAARALRHLRQDPALRRAAADSGFGGGAGDEFFRIFLLAGRFGVTSSDVVRLLGG